MDTEAIIAHLREYMPADRQPDANVLLRTAANAFQAIEMNVECEIESAFDGHDIELAMILTLIVSAVLYPTPTCRKDARLAAANLMMEQFKSARGAAH